MFVINNTYMFEYIYSRVSGCVCIYDIDGLELVYSLHCSHLSVEPSLKPSNQPYPNHSHTNINCQPLSAKPNQSHPTDQPTKTNSFSYWVYPFKTERKPILRSGSNERFLSTETVLATVCIL